MCVYYTGREFQVGIRRKLLEREREREREEIGVRRVLKERRDVIMPLGACASGFKFRGLKCILSRFLMMARGTGKYSNIYMTV